MKPTRRAFTLLISVLMLTGCVFAPATPDPGTAQTQMALGVQATMLAQQSAQGVQLTLEAQQATMVAQAAQATVLAQQITEAARPTEPPVQEVDTAATQVAASVDATMQAASAVQTQAPAEEPVMETETAAIDFDTWKKDASILLYEDMVNRPDASRYAKAALDQLDLPYDDVGSAKGNLKSRMLSGGPGGKGWDLVIIAAEVKSGVSGEFFTYVNDALNLGSSVILEVWYLDQTFGGKASDLLARCGVEFGLDWASVPPSRMVMFPLEAEHPMLHEPNDGVRFTKVTDYWAYNWDIGDLMELTPNSKATLLVGTMATEKRTHGTVTICVDDRLILQTFSSHQLSRDTMVPIWQNYITHALQARYNYLNQP